jgi:hypothetical protein
MDNLLYRIHSKDNEEEFRRNEIAGPGLVGIICSRAVAYYGDSEDIKEILRKDRTYDHISYLLCKFGRLDQIHHLKIKNLNWCLVGACAGNTPNNTAIARMLIDKGATSFEEGMKNACQCGNISIVQLMMPKIKDVECFNIGFKCACAMGHVDVMKLMVEKTKPSKPILDDGFRISCRFSQLEAVKFIIQEIESSGGTVDIGCGIIAASIYQDELISPVPHSVFEFLKKYELEH